MARISFDGSPRNESDPYGTTLDLGNGITQTMAPGYAPSDTRSPNVYTDQPALNPVSGTPYTGLAPIGQPVTTPTPQNLHYDNSLTTKSSDPFGGGRTMDDNTIAGYVSQWAAMSGADPSLKNDPNYWIRRIKETGGLGSDNLQYWQNAGVGSTAFFNNPNRESSGSSVLSGTPPPSGPTAAPGPNPGGYDDPSSMLFLNEVMNRLNQLKQPQDTTLLDKLRAMALARVDSLNGAPYTAGEENALVTQMRDPLTLARDTAKKQKADDLARRGIGPSSGLYASEMGKIDQAYERGMAQGTNQLAVNAVTEKQRRADEQLSILMNLLGTTNTQQDRANQQAREVLQTAEVFPNFDEKRLQDLLGASNDGASNPGSLLSSIMQLGNLNLNAQNTANANSQASASTWGQILGYLLNNL